MEIQRCRYLHDEVGHGWRAIAKIINEESGQKVSHMTVKRALLRLDRG